MPSEVRKLRELEEENARLRKLIADLTLDKEMLSEVIKKSYDRDTGKRNDRLRPNLLSRISKTRLPRRTCLSCDQTTVRVGRIRRRCANGSGRSRRPERAMATGASTSFSGVKAGE